MEAGHNLTVKALWRLVGTRSQHYVAGLNRLRATGGDISDQREPTGRGTLGGNCLMSLKHTAFGRGRDDLVHGAPDQSEKLAGTAQGHSAVPHFEKLPGKRMAAQYCELAVGRSGEAIREGETG